MLTRQLGVLDRSFARQPSSNASDNGHLHAAAALTTIPSHASQVKMLLHIQQTHSSHHIT